eukprot:m.813295 g.813295  ORF g.813295 m.813295 type:complete len:118 (-) comp59358_c0_seq4:3436-3789(-)
MDWKSGRNLVLCENNGDPRSEASEAREVSDFRCTHSSGRSPCNLRSYEQPTSSDEFRYTGPVQLENQRKAGELVGVLQLLSHMIQPSTTAGVIPGHVCKESREEGEMAGYPHDVSST